MFSNGNSALYASIVTYNSGLQIEIGGGRLHGLIHGLAQVGFP
jgi:hypothetical protein